MRLCAALLLLLSATGAQAEPLAIIASTVDAFSRTEPSRTAFGPLTFRGGLVLTSASENFGGLSGLRVAEDGVHFRAISDRANWVEGRLVYDSTKLTAVADMGLTPILGADGRKLAGTRSGDTEGLEISGTTAWIGVERKHQVLRFDLAAGVGAAKGVPVALPKAVAGLPYNEGLEALGLVPGGAEKDTLLIVAEAGLDAEGNHRAWLLPGRSGKPARSLSVKRRDEYAITDLTFLPGGDLVLLERRYRPPFSLTFRLRRVAQADIAADAVLDGEVLLEASLADEIDNMEGISAHRAEAGTSVLTLVSDNNFNSWQRTMLLQFAIAD